MYDVDYNWYFSLTATNETLDEKCEELRKQFDELNREVEIERRKNERLQQEKRIHKEELLASANKAPGFGSVQEKKINANQLNGDSINQNVS